MGKLEQFEMVEAALRALEASADHFDLAPHADQCFGLALQPYCRPPAPTTPSRTSWIVAQASGTGRRLLHVAVTHI
jgi:hypothetical protein